MCMRMHAHSWSVIHICQQRVVDCIIVDSIVDRIIECDTITITIRYDTKRCIV